MGAPSSSIQGKRPFHAKGMIENIDPYVRWGGAHNSLLTLTWDEDDGTRGVDQYHYLGG